MDPSWHCCWPPPQVFLPDAFRKWLDTQASFSGNLPRAKGFDYSIRKILKEVQFCFFYTWTLCSCPIWTLKPFTFVYRTKWFKHPSRARYRHVFCRVIIKHLFWRFWRWSQNYPRHSEDAKCVCQESVVRPWAEKRLVFTTDIEGFWTLFFESYPKHP